MKTTTKHNVEAMRRANVALSRNGNAIKPRQTRNRAAKREALLQAALRLFARKGYDATTTREIAASAGCAEGLIHRYFKGKPGLLAAMIEHRSSKEVLDLSRQPRPTHNLENEFLQLVDREVERIWESRDFLRVIIPRAIVDPSLGTVMSEAIISVRAKAIRERLQQCESRLTLRQGATEVLVQAVGMLGFVYGFVWPVLLGRDRSAAKKMAVTMAKLLVGSPEVSVVA